MSEDNQKKETIKQEAPSEKPTKQPGTGVFSSLSRDLNDDDLKNPAVGRMLLHRIDVLTGEKIKLEGYEVRFHEADKKSAILEQKVLGENKFQILYSFCLAVGGVIFGIAFAIPDKNIKTILIVLGIVLFMIGVILSFFVNRK